MAGSPSALAFLPPHSGGLKLLHRPHQHENLLPGLIILDNIPNNIHLPRRNQFDCELLMQHRRDMLEVIIGVHDSEMGNEEM